MDKGSNNQDELDVLPYFLEKAKSTKPSSQVKHFSRPTIEEEYNLYDTTNQYRGLALVFCNIEFEKMAKRDGSIKDRDDICNTLKKLAFDVQMFDNFTKKEIIETLKEWSNEKHHVKSDCLVVVVMSYGETGFVYAKDEKYKMDSLWKYFVGNACPSLIGKPKMFFIQACELIGGKSNNFKDHALCPKINRDSGCQKASYFIPTWADLLIMDNGQNSLKDELQRSCFIQSLCKELNDNAENRELLTLLTRVIRRTIYEYTLSDPIFHKVQVPCLVSMLTKSFYFYKKK